MSPQHQGRSHILPEPGDSASYKAKVYGTLFTVVLSLAGLLWAVAQLVGDIKTDIVVLEIRADTTEAKIDKQEQRWNVVEAFMNSLDKRAQRIEDKLGIPST